MSNIHPILLEDLSSIAARFPHWERLRGTSVLVTGATGLVGSMLVRALCAAPVPITVIAHVRNEQKARDMFGDLPISYCSGDVTKPVRFDGPVDHIFHTASVTASKAFVSQPVQTLTTAIDGTRNLLEFAREKGVRSMVYVSSMEAFGITDPALPRITEADLGYIDILAVRSSYSEGKRICECAWISTVKCSRNAPVRPSPWAATLPAAVWQLLWHCRSRQRGFPDPITLSSSPRV